MKRSIKPELRELALRMEQRGTFFTYTGATMSTKSKNIYLGFAIFFGSGTIPWDIGDAAYNNGTGGIMVTKAFYEDQMDAIYQRYG